MQKRKKLLIAFASFFVLMWALTLTSKAVYISKLPQITTDTPAPKYIEHTVEAPGIVIQGGVWATVTLDGLRVEKLHVREGDRVEAGDILFQIDTEDLKETIDRQKDQIAKLQYNISDQKTNRELAQQRRQIEEARTREDYAAADTQTGITSDRAAAAQSDADSTLQDHRDHPAHMTSDAGRQQAWDNYDNWSARQKELIRNITETKQVITDLEDPEKEAPLTEEEQELLKEEKILLTELLNALAVHEENPVSIPDFSAEDDARKAWQQEETMLEDALKQAGYTNDDAAQDRDAALKQANREIDDATFPENADSSMQINQIDLAALQDDLLKYQEIIENGGNISAERSGMVTRIDISTGDRTTGTAAMLLTDDTIPCQFKTSVTKEQKKYVNLGDTVQLQLDKNELSLEMTVDYIAENEMSPGTFDIFLNLDESKGIPGLSGTMKAVSTGPRYECCIPAQALYSEDGKYFIYALREREGILGPELCAEKIMIRLRDQNDRYVALEEDIIDQDTDIITSVTKEIKRGDVVRY